MSDDPLKRLAQLALHADPRVRDQRKIEKQLNRKPTDRHIIRCTCKDNRDIGHRILCDVCHCYSHFECFGISPDELPEHWICPFCQNASTQYLVNAGVDIPQMHRKIVDFCRTSRSRTYLESFNNVQLAQPRTENSAQWMHVLAKRDDIYKSMFRAASKCMKSSAAATSMQEFTEERKVINYIGNELDEMVSELSSLQTPLLDAITEQINSYKPEPKQSRTPQPQLTDGEGEYRSSDDDATEE